MYFQHAPDIWRDFPELAAGVVTADGIRPDVDVGDKVARFIQIARERLGDGAESGLPEIQAWRRVYAQMGFKPTQWRGASESLLRRLRKEGDLPRIHPLVDLCNAISVAWAIPLAAFDLDQIADNLEVRYACGDERYVTFAGETERPKPGEVNFVDSAWQAHARRWTNRQSGLSAVRDSTSRVLIVAEAMHDTGAADIDRVITTLTDQIREVWSVAPHSAILTLAAPRFEV